MTYSSWQNAKLRKEARVGTEIEEMLLQLVGRIFLGPALILRRPDSSSSYAESSGSGSGSLVQDGRTDEEQTNKPTQNMKI